jgi:hypothetical protein
MRVGSLVIIAGLFAASPSAAGGQTAAKSNLPEIVNAYCSTCHDGTMRSPSGVLLDVLDPTRIHEKPELWARVYRQLQAGTMPPVGASRPDRPTYNAALTLIERALNAGPKTEPATSQEIAERLAALLWNSVPNASLLQDAKRNRLNEPAVLEHQINRMLADVRTEAFVSRFFFPWLGLDKLRNSDPDKEFFPEYEVSLRDAFAEETKLFLLSQLRDDRDPVELWSAKYTFLNEQLARHYRIPNIRGTHFRTVTLPSPERAGLLGQGSILMVTSRHQHGWESAYTSPASRSTWVLRHFLGVPPPAPFPGAPPVKKELPITPQTRTLPVQPCVTCHRNFFPLGYALENFDPIGAWRTHDQAGPVDVSGTFVDGNPTNGVIALRNVLLQRPDAFRTTITENLLIYASGKPLGTSRPGPETLVRARGILNGMNKPRWSKIIAGMVR